MSRFSPENWSPNSLEQQCLRHLDSAENWETVLKRSRPAETQILSWRPFIKIFFINLLFFSLIVFVLLIVIAIGTLGFSSLREDFPLLLGLIAIISTAMAIYTSHLYRRTWNRRAKQLLHH